MSGRGLLGRLTRPKGNRGDSLSRYFGILVFFSCLFRDFRYFRNFFVVGENSEMTVEADITCFA